MTDGSPVIIDLPALPQPGFWGRIGRHILKTLGSGNLPA